MGTLFVMSVAALIVVGAQFWYIIWFINIQLQILMMKGINRRRDDNTATNNNIHHVHVKS